MNCPKCQSADFKPFETMEGVTVDFCGKCRAAWFEEGELAFYLETRKDLPKLEDSLKTAKPTSFGCPACPGEKLVELRYHPTELAPLLDYCGRCRGVLLDPSEVGKAELVAAKYGLVDVAGVLAELRSRGYSTPGA